MSMPESAEEVDSALIEAEIERELQKLDLNNSLDDTSVEEDPSLAEDEWLNDGDVLPDILQAYVQRAESRACQIETDLEECETILKPTDVNSGQSDIRDVLSQFQELEGEDPEMVKNKILTELEDEDDNDESDLPEESFITETQPGEGSSDLTSQPGGGAVMIVYEFHQLEKEARQQLKVLDEKLKLKELERAQNEEVLRQEAQSRLDKTEEERHKTFQAIKDEEAQISTDRKAKQLEFEKQAKEQQRRIEEELLKFEKEINALAEKTEQEKQDFKRALQEEKQKDNQRREKAALTIQSAYKGYRVRQCHGAELSRRVEEKKKESTEKRLQEIGQQRQRKADEERKQKELDEQEKLRLQKQKEDEVKERKEEEERERLRLDEERRRAEEEERSRIEEEQKKEEEEERKRKEEETRRIEEEKRKEQEEQRRREEVERMKREEEERARKLEEERVQREAEEKRKLEEQKRIEEERRREEARQKEVERKRLEEERLRKEEEERKAEEERRRKEAEAERLRVQEEQKRLEAQRLKEEQERLERERARQEAAKLSNKIDDALAETIENERLNWIQSNKPFSQVCSELKTKRVSKRRPPRRPQSAKHLPALSEQVILQAARVNALRLVTTVELSDLPGCSLSTLGQCGQMKALTMNRCGVITLDELDGCTQLQYIDMSHNNIEMVHLKDTTKLHFLDLSHNSLSSIHGLDSCEELHFLDLSHNKITRIAGLASFSKLHSLNLSHNQLISTKGLAEGATIHVLDLSHNHLQSVEEISSLCLLGVFRCIGNNILEVPEFTNHALLRELLLDDNSISSLSKLSDSWLPLLYKLGLSQNSITVLPELRYCQLLNSLDMSHNQITELTNLGNSLKILRSLEALKLCGNPVTEDPNFSSCINQKVPLLHQLDESQFNHDNQHPTERSLFESACLQQVHTFVKMNKMFEEQIRSMKTASPVDYLRVACATKEFLENSHRLAIEHRNAHEYGDFGSAEAEEQLISKEQPSLIEAKNTELKGETDAVCSKSLADPDQGEQRTPTNIQKMDMKNKADSAGDIMSGKNRFDALYKQADVSEVGKGIDVNSNGGVIAEGLIGKRPGTAVNASHVGKLLAQEGVLPKASPPLGRKPTSAGRRQTDLKFRQHKAAGLIQATWRGYIARLYVDHLRHQQSQRNSVNEYDSAATKIQALWRGYSLRKKLNMALNFARINYDDDDEDDFFDQEIDLNAFNPDNLDLDAEWLPPSTPQIPKSHPVLTSPPKQKYRPDSSLSDGQPPLPREAWRNSPMAAGYLMGKPPLPPDSRMSGAETHRTAQSKKEELLSEEWGFKDNRTAELMMQRAKKLKYNAQHKKKLSKLDPQQRLALFRKLEESSGVPRVQHSHRKQPERKDYFQAREEQEHKATVVKEEQMVANHRRTFEWLHSQVSNANVPDTSPPSKGSYHRASSLPQMDPSIVNGGRVQLMASPSPTPMELQSVDGESLSGSSLRERRHSSGAISGQTVELPPIKTNSAPSDRVRERISFRDNKVNLGPGWGSGKKRTNKRR